MQKAHLQKLFDIKVLLSSYITLKRKVSVDVRDTSIPQCEYFCLIYLKVAL